MLIYEANLKMKNLIFTLLIMLYFASCRQSNIENESLNQIENLFKAYPDSALILLNSLELPTNDLYNQNRFFLLRIRAKDFAKKDISLDKEILDIYEYFKNNNHDYYTNLAAYYCGRVLQENKDYESAIKYYKIADSNIQNFSDENSHGIILYSMGDLMLEQLLIDEAKVKFSEANALFIQTKNYKYEIKTYKQLGRYYLLADKIDSSLLYYNKGLDLSIKYNDIEEQALITQNIGVLLNEKKEYRKAINTLLKALEIDRSVHQSGRLFLNLAQSYTCLDQADSAKYYISLGLEWAKKSSKADVAVIATLYKVLSQIEEQSNNYKDALSNHKLYSKNLAEIIFQNKNTAIIDAENKYKFDVMKNENIMLSVKQLKTQQLLIFALFILALFTIIYYNILLRKNKQLTNSNEKIVNLTDDIITLTDRLIGFDSTIESYKDNLVHNFNILKRASALEFFVNDSGNKQGQLLIKRFNEIAYGKESIDWDILYNTINAVNNGLFDKLRNKYTDLAENEFRICCLIYCKFNSNEIAVITQLSINTVHMKTTYIRKKLGIEKYGNIIDYLNMTL